MRESWLGRPVVVVGADDVVVVIVVVVVVEEVEDVVMVVVGPARVVAVGPASSRSMAKTRTPRTITATAIEQPSENQRSVVSQLLKPSSTRSRAQSSSSRVVISGGMKRITLASGPQLMMISSRS